MATPTKKKHRTPIAMFIAPQSTTLLEVLDVALPSMSRSKRKSFLQNRCVTLRGEPTTQYDAVVNPGDAVEVFNVGFPKKFASPFANILWQDEYFVLVEKKIGIATVSNHPGLKVTLFKIIANHLKEQYGSNEKIFLLNRLDSETHGLILFARSREVQQRVLAEWKKYIPQQQFTAVVEGLFTAPEGELKGRIQNKLKSTSNNRPTTRRSATRYRVLAEGEYTSLIEISLLGRFNGIRTLLIEEEQPILGEKTPIAVIQTVKPLLIKQTSLTLIHPISKKRFNFSLSIPSEFYKYLQKPLTRSERARALEQNRLNNKNNSTSSLTDKRNTRKNKEIKK